MPLTDQVAADIRLLRSRGWTVTFDGHRFMVGSRPCTAAQLRRMANRQRRLLGMSTVVAVDRSGRPMGYRISGESCAKVGATMREAWARRKAATA